MYVLFVLMVQLVGFVVGYPSKPVDAVCGAAVDVVLVNTFSKYLVALVAAVQLAVKLLPVTLVAFNASKVPKICSPPINLKLIMPFVSAMSVMGLPVATPDQLFRPGVVLSVSDVLLALPGNGSPFRELSQLV